MLDLVFILTIKKIPTEGTQKEIPNISNPVITKEKNQQNTKEMAYLASTVNLTLPRVIGEGSLE